MSDLSRHIAGLPLRQPPSRGDRIHPTNPFIEFKKEEIEQSIPDRFEQQVRKYPDRLAVKTKNHPLTYKDLNQAANRLAHAILEHRGKRQEPIALLFEHSASVIVAILGVLKAGKMYVPLDPSYPHARLTSILEDSHAPLMVTNHRNLLSAKKLSQNALQLIDVDDLSASLSDENLGLSIAPDTLAYILYTSGSTGQPKGVVQNHRNVLHNMMKYINGSHICADDRLSFLFSFSFSAAVTNVFGALLNGASLFPFNLREERLADLAAWLIQEEITIYHSVGTVFRHFSDTLTGEEKFPKLRLIELTGEPVILSDVKRYKKHFSDDCLLHNRMAATEMSLIRQYFLDKNTLIKGGIVPVGYAVEDTEICLLDEAGENVGVDHIGEITIKSRYLVPGYWRQPELTRAVFRPDPARSDARIYHTGDLGRMSLDGCLEHLGRKDFRVKIRGHRIEVGEIETALLDHATVKEAVVVAREDMRGDKYLVAYIASNQKPLPRASELRSFLGQNLPDYMLPSTFVMLDVLPLTANGKVDRNALPAPDTDRPELEHAFVAPHTPVEEILAGIWAEVLGLKQVGIHDSFHNLGGNSLLATRVISRVFDTFGIEVSLRTLFDTPTVAGLCQRVEAARREGRGQRQDLKSLPLQPVPRDKQLRFPMSFAQQRLWFLDQLEPDTPIYNIPKAIRMSGTLDVQALKNALEGIVGRHEALRTTFASVDGSPVQMIGECRPVELPVVEFGEVPQAERDSRVQQQLVVETQRPFDLSNDLMLRALLLRLSKEEHILLLVLHHIASDGWSSGILFREIATLYEAFSTGHSSPLAHLPIQYVDFAHWQRSRLNGHILEEQVAYWKQQLRHPSPVFDLPTDHRRPAIQSYRGARQDRVLPRTLSEALSALSHRKGVTLFMTLLAALNTLLHRYTGQYDVSVGSPIANRNRAQIEGIIGFFANTLVLRTDLSGDPTFEELLTRVREVALGAYAHQDLPFEKLVEELQPERTLRHTPLFQIMFVLQNAPSQALELSGMSLSPQKVDSGISKFDLTLEIAEDPDGLSCSVEYNTDLFEAATISRTLGHFQTLLEAVVADPNQRLSQLPLLTEGERHQVVTWKGTTACYPKDTCIHQLFEAQVERTPDNVALTFENRQLTYRELNARANRLAHSLKKCGVGPETLVGICVEPSLEMVIGLLGILKAGGAYVPLDPAYPKERLGFTLEDSQVPVLLTQKSLVSYLPPHNAKVAYLDTSSRTDSLDDSQAEKNPVNEATADNLAYVIYTSGSTGKPKGVQVTHDNVTRLFRATDPWFHFDQNDIWTLFHSYAFDFSVWEIWGALLYGGQLTVIPHWVSRSPETFYNLLRERRVTVLNMTPSAFRQLIQAEELSTNRHELALRFVIFGGEALDFQSLTPWFDRHGDQRPQLINMYGITETAVHATYYPVTETDAQPGLGSVIGRPIPDLELYVLDQHRMPVPIGVPGELYVGGPGVARGYLNRPELTTERFISNPFGHRKAAKLYRSGDLVRYRYNGDIEYLGRIDAQIKIRGFRVEPGEIEVDLKQHPAVSEAVVTAREDVPSDKRLVAYIVSKQELQPTVTELRNFLKQKLPDYMVPSVFVPLVVLPLTPNGKVDHRALPVPNQTRPDLEKAFVPPRTPVEETLVGIWAEILKLEQVGIYDNFFDLGGHSLLATQVISRVRESLQVVIPLRSLFENPTVAGLAVQIVKAEAIKATPEEMADVLDDIESLSDEQAQHLFVQESRKGV